jgi:hypothetical protein
VAKRSKPMPGTGDASMAASAAAAIKDGEPAATPVVGTRAMFTLSDRALHLLDTAVLVDGMDRGAVVECLICTHLAGYFSGKPVPAMMPPV